MGGLVLAHALVRAGDEVTVFDRDVGAAATGGYRLHLNARACAALRRHLAPEVYQAVLASAAGSGGSHRLAITDHRLRVLGLDVLDRSAEQLLIGRVPLRTLLCRGLEDRLCFDRRFTRFEQRPDHTVAAHFADGSSTAVDLLVGADGASSRVAAALAGRPTSTRLGLGGVAGRTPLADRPVPDLLRRGPALALGPGGIGVFLAVHDPAAAPAVDPSACTAVPAELEPAALVWAVLADDRRYPGGIERLPGAQLPDAAAALLRGWHPAVRDLVAAGEPAASTYFAFRAADPAADLTPWPAGRVTALGDAVHAMPPTGGQGAATAIHDADRLAAHLAGVRAGRTALATAVADFHRDMAGYAPAAVAESLRPVRWIRALGGPTTTVLARAALPAAAAAAAAARAARRTGRGSPFPREAT
jgi:2-polyprenyl-6-methoxyphenol hydroxylase-like FAD-dependent oxidoreductase